jgi:catechol 2,3-dioxygenase-like lactoylglutathione lyase family enzyme
MTTDPTDDELTGTILGPDGHERRFRVGEVWGEVFVEDEDFCGITLTIEVASLQEGMALADLIDSQGRKIARAAPIGF